jgi:plastocyanin
MPIAPRSGLTAPTIKPACAFAATAVALTLAVVGCGGSNASSSQTGTPSQGSAAGSKLQLQADPSGRLRYIPAKLSAKAGKITITFTNNSPAVHNVAIRRGTRCQSDTRCAALGLLDIGSTDLFQRGSRTLSVNLKPGNYVFYCQVPGHEAGGMQGTLTVSP